MSEIKEDKFDLLDVCHHFSSGLKSVHTDEAYYGMIQIRQALGGAGYSTWSGIPRLIEEYSPVVTFEGDNTVMA